MKQLLISLFLFSLLFSSGFDSFSEFEKFDKNDKQEFKTLKKKAESCINSWDFSCASDTLDKMKLYVTSPKDKKIISSLWDKYYDEKAAKRNYEARKANQKKSVSLRSTGDGCYSVKADGNYVGSICAKYSGGDYDIFTYPDYSSSYAKCSHPTGMFFTNPPKLYISDTQTSIHSNSLSDALYKMANYWVNCSVY